MLFASMTRKGIEHTYCKSVFFKKNKKKGDSKRA